MSLCHFCFRCRRPACSQCWDGVHGVCGDCVCQAHLSFRTEAAPLDGVRFPPLRSQGVPHEEVASSLLVCVKAGRFLLETELADGMTVEAVKMNEKKPAQQSKIFEDVATVRPAKLLQPVQEPVTVAGAVEVGEDNEADEEVAHRPHTTLRVLRVLERVLTVLALVVLVAIVVLVALAQFSAAANTLIIQVVRIDIRAEIAYLVHLVQQLH